MEKAIIITRCSTDESRQSVELQIKPCKEYCERQGWEFDVVSYYGSASKGVPEQLQKVLDSITRRDYQVCVVHSMDRFSRLKPAVTERMLTHITDCNCRFISLQENLDSDNSMLWFTMKGMWLYFANLYSLNLSKKVKMGMAKAKAEGKAIGRPMGAKDKRKRGVKGYYNRKYKFK